MVSIIIPKRRGEDITELLFSIKRSSYKNYEIVVVDEGLERSAQRNIGIKRSKGKYLLILDSDQHLSPMLLDECIFLMQAYDALYIPETITTKGLFAYIRNWERQFYNGTPVDAVRFVKKEFCPLFDEGQSGPEDSDWDRRVGGMRTVTLHRFYHHENVSMLGYFKKKAYYAKSMARFDNRNKNDKVLNFWWRCFGVYFENGKWRRALSRPDLMLCVWGIILIRGLIYVYARNHHRA